ncbi:MAG: prolipoprotein diacylglyceryl transferase [Bacteroidales bacterium]|jgi:prolipoprotein diacylglyceryl transferase|nr:prolipoprotein diacylglyceryl transferase [Bacteroidales bacterium]
MILDYIVWTFDPVAFSLFGLEVRWYGVIFASIFGVGLYILGKMFKHEGLNDNSLADSIFWYVALGVFIGARLGHCFFYEPYYYLTHPLEILAVRDGGLASHGAAVCVPIALWILSRKKKISFWYIVDRVVVILAFGAVFIRTGNLFNSEIYGHPTTLPWGFIFANNGETLPKHPTQIYESLSYLILFITLFTYFWRKKGKIANGMLLGYFLIGCFGARFFIEFLKENQEGIDQHLKVLDMGQLLSIPLIIAGIVVLFLARKKKFGVGASSKTIAVK